VLEIALDDWQAMPVVNLGRLEADQNQLRVLDQLLFRFTKLQDALGQRLVPATLAALSEPFEEWSMIDRLNRLEKLGYLEVDAWLRWRKIRNRLAHEYPDCDEIRFAALTALSPVTQAPFLRRCPRQQPRGKNKLPWFSRKKSFNQRLIT
jgi:hypothetical protein